MRRKNLTGRTVSLKVKYHDFKQITRAKTLANLTDDGLEIYGAACDLLRKTEVGKRPVRLLGISLSQLCFADAAGQLSLFADDQSLRKRKNLNLAVDSIMEKHGGKGVRPATLVHNPNDER